MIKYISTSRKLFLLFDYLLLVSTGFVCLLPFINLLAISFSGSAPVSAGRVLFWPVEFTLSSYEFAVKGGKFFVALWVSIKRVILGVSINITMMICAAYPLAKNKEHFRWRNIYMVYFLVTIIISGGLIPLYIVVVKLKLIDSLWALVLPGALPVGTMVILMNFIRQMPQDIEEAAIIDGAGVFSRLIRVILPLLKPALATVGLFCIVGHWNDWFGGIIFMNRPENYPLQSYLQTLLTSIEEMMRFSGIDYTRLLGMMSARTGRAAQLFLGAVPMMVVYPFLQRYFTTGLVLGSVKG
ncbi:MAG: carbohydrate ABC transporter permease [Treponema sp.]|jgi:putative aldouronate transport system permease protein|nr:carbohydrate ABC transporter permease [Treponema sp.]